jgi:asparagine synthase (glutamine-hydrolysing)
MCGICGKLTHKDGGVTEDLLRRMNTVLAHRGPDDEGLYLYQGRNGGSPSVSVGLAHRRLSIIDLSPAGRQPMANEDGTVRTVFNGEIYNFQILRDELKKKGHRFRSDTDGEVIVHLYEEEGADLVRRLTGMFAFALWDEKQESLLLGRDPVGIKPLVYCWNGRSLIFASELKAVLQDPEVSREMDWNALDLYLSLNYIPAPHTIFKGVRKLRPGHILTVRNGVLKEERFWNIATGPLAETSKSRCFEETKATLFQTLEEAVRSQMIADVPLGAFLSGGIDSSIIVGLMARNSSRPVKTYSIGYADMPMFDETGYARDVARMHRTDHHEIRLKASDIITAIPDVLNSFDEPFADSSAVPTFVVSRETVKEVKVALSGDGGDELFAGYRMYRGENLYASYALIPPFLRKRVIEPVVLGLPESRDRHILERVRRLKKFVRGAGGSFEDRFFAWNEILSRDLKEKLLVRPDRMDLDHGKRLFSERLNEMKSDDINRMLYADLKESLPGDMLRKVDAMSMLNSLEVRVPLLDHRVCELAFSIPGDLKIRKGIGKYILMETFRDILPQSLHRRPKWGFEMPVSQWLKKDLHYLIDEYLAEKVISRQGIFHYAQVKDLVDGLMSGRRDTSWQLWNLIAFQSWHSRYGS